MVNPRKKPEFRRWLSQTLRRIEPSWRKSRGMHSKIRVRKVGKFKMPSVGYGAPKQLRFLHPSGFEEVLISTPEELGRVDAKTQAIKIAHTVGKKKRQEILKKAEELKVKVLNP